MATGTYQFRERVVLEENLGDLITERRRPELAELDLLGTGELVRLMAQEEARVPEAVAREAPRIGAAIDAVAERLREGGRLVYVGAGTAGRMGVLDAVECGPTFGVPPGRVVGVLAGGRKAMFGPREDAEDGAEAGASDLAELGVAQEDAVVGISASGRTPYTLGAIRYARGRGALTVGISCNPGARLSGEVDHPIEVVVGPEVIAGSTRLKAGTAQKLVLNMISTISMIRLGKTYGNLMVDVRASNAKLRDRARRIVELATGAKPEEAAAALDRCGGEAKVAIVSLLLGVGPEEARRRLSSGGGVRAALRGRERRSP